jgi:hypothetical protein
MGGAIAVRVLLGLAVLALLYGCAQASSPAAKQEGQGGVEKTRPESVPETVTPPAPNQEGQRREETTAAAAGNMPIAAGVVGESVEGSSFDFRILDYFVTDHYFYLEDPRIEEAREAFPRAGKFVVVNYSVTNTGPQTIRPLFRAQLHLNAGGNTKVYEESAAVAHPSESLGMQLAPREVELSQFIFEVPREADPEVLAVSTGSSYASAKASPGGEEVGVIDLTKEDPKGPRPQEVLALQHEYYNMTAWERAYELFAQESKDRVPKRLFVSHKRREYRRSPTAFTRYSFPAVNIEGDRATMHIVLTYSQPAGEQQERIVQEAVLEDEGWRIVMPDEQVKSSTQGDPVLVGAGDIASCASSGDEATAALLDGIPGTVFTTGDNAYRSGTVYEFAYCYGPSWGRHKARTKPTVGNHEYDTAGASGYFGYFGAAAGDPDKGYYSYDLGEWHIVALNSMCEEVGGCGANSPMVSWLKQDLAANPASCTAAIFHHPLFSSGAVHGNDPKMRPSWYALYAAGAEVVLNGHEHTYERFAPQTPRGTADPAHGIREFIVGTGGASHYPFGTIEPNSQVRSSGTFGVLKLTLHPASYDWRFVPEAGKTFTDSGSDQCHAAPGAANR